MDSDADRSMRFRRAVGEPLFAALEAEHAVVFALTFELLIEYVNPAWRRYAEDNGGSGELLQACVGVFYPSVLPLPLVPFYLDHLAAVRDGRTDWVHHYECPSPSSLRVFRMHVMRAPAQPYLLVFKDLEVELPAPVAEADLTRYRNADGMVIQCCHCRRARRTDVGGELWDFVPAFLADPPPALSHGICSVCAEYHYPDPDGEERTPLSWHQPTVSP